MDCLYVLLSTLRLSLRFSLANHRQLSLPSSAWNSLEKVVVYKAASGKAVNQMASDWSWSHLNIRPALWLEVGPLWKTRGILQYKILPGDSPFLWHLLGGSKVERQIILCWTTFLFRSRFNDIFFMQSTNMNVQSFSVLKFSSHCVHCQTFLETSEKEPSATFTVTLDFLSLSSLSFFLLFSLLIWLWDFLFTLQELLCSSLLVKLKLSLLKKINVEAERLFGGHQCLAKFQGHWCPSSQARDISR